MTVAVAGKGIFFLSNPVFLWSLNMLSAFFVGICNSIIWYTNYDVGYVCHYMSSATAKKWRN